MNDRDEIAQLRLLDTFLENGETDRHDWRDEVGAALDRARTSCPRSMEPMPEHDGSSSGAYGEDADILANLEMMKGGAAGSGMASVKLNKYQKFLENITDDDLEIASAVANRVK